MRAVTEHPHAVIRPAGQVDRVLNQGMGAVGLQALAWAQKTRMGVDQFSGQGAFSQQLPRPIQVLQYQIQQLRTLHQSTLGARPFVGADDQRHRVDLPKAPFAVLFVVDVVGDPILSKHLPGLLPASFEFASADLLQNGHQLLPMGAQCVSRSSRRQVVRSKLIVGTGEGRVLWVQQLPFGQCMGGRAWFFHALSVSVGGSRAAQVQGIGVVAVRL